MKIKNVYLTIFLLSLICVLISSINVNPDATMLNLFGYKIGLNFTHNVWLRIIGFISLFLYIFNPLSKKQQLEK